ncbi:TPA: hypothetical protein SUB30_003392 [Bacillus pseudomycoides]|nr:hypothetical protein [Bacillus pseudomycoides]
MILKEDCRNQLEIVLKDIKCELIKESKIEEIEKCFSYLYIVNFVSKKYVLRNFFKNTAFNVSYSCLIESLVLLLENHPRGSALVLRSALENFLKSIIETAGEGQYKINEKSYLANKNTMDKVIEDKFPDKYQMMFKTINNQMYTVYGKLSGLSHSLTTESQRNLLLFFSDTNNLNKPSIDSVFEKFLAVLDCIFTSCLLIVWRSLENWERGELKEVLLVVFGGKRTEKMLSLFSKSVKISLV